ncbi:MAG: DUF2922 domain-containing protein [Clostridiales bacterium]|jgi:hypothetical protein|nr:DUF2922 domain-containing protein [Clostridiales bacterium]
MAVSNSIRLTFAKENGEHTSITVPYADSAVDAEDVKEAMDAIIAAEVIEIDGEGLTSPVEAELIEVETTDYVIE